MDSTTNSATTTAAPKKGSKGTKKKVVKKKAVAKKKVAKKKAAPKRKAPAKKKAATSGKKLWRFGFVTSPKGREVNPRVSKTGHLSTRAAKRLKMKQVPKWGRIASTSRQAALTALKAGKGEWFTPAKGE